MALRYPGISPQTASSYQQIHQITYNVAPHYLIFPQNEIFAFTGPGVCRVFNLAFIIKGSKEKSSEWENVATSPVIIWQRSVVSSVRLNKLAFLSPVREWVYLCIVIIFGLKSILDTIYM